MMLRDQIFQTDQTCGDFKFDVNVTQVFDDMIRRSVPNYEQVQSIMVDIARDYYQPGTSIFDLGCSLGETALRLAKAISGCHVVGFDSSKDMIASAQRRIEANGFKDSIKLVEANIEDPLPEDVASVVIMSLTLQFIRPLDRTEMVRNAFRALQPGGVILLFEKTILRESTFNRYFIDKYYKFKADNGYTEDEIARKRIALENVLIPFTIEENIDLLERAGFSEAQCFFQWFNFSAFVGMK